MKGKQISRADVVRTLKDRIAMWKEEKRSYPRYSFGWNRADTALTELTDLLANIRRM